MGFSITLLPELVPEYEEGINATYGLIEIGSFQERFTSSLVYWRREDYKSHWVKAIDRIVNHSNVSCLITSMINPKTGNFIFWWPIYREKDIVYFHNQILFFDQLSSQFNENDPFSFVSQREVINEEGQKISEWSISILDLELFLSSNKLNT